MSSEDFFNQSFSPVAKKDSNSNGHSGISIGTSIGTSTSSKRPSPPPPPPAPSASSSIRSRINAPTSGSTTRSTTGSMAGSTTTAKAATTAATTATSTASGAYYRNSHLNRASTSSSTSASTSTNRMNIKAAARPTGDYYATTTPSPAAPTAFPSYKGYSTNNYNDANAANTIAAPSPYGSSSSASSNVNTSANPSSATNITSNTNGTPANDDGQWFHSGSTSAASKTVTNGGMDNTSSTMNNTPYSSVTHPSPSPYMMPQPQPQPQPQQPHQQPQPHHQANQMNQMNQPQGQAIPASNSMDYLSGTMDNNAANGGIGMSGPMMMSTNNSSTNSFGNNNPGSAAPNSSSFSASYRYTYNPDDFADEPPLLEELGINLSHIRTKSLSVILPGRYAKQAIDKNLMEDTDMAGPIAFGILLALELLCAGRIHFGYIYGFGLFGCLAMTLIINLMSPTDSISIWTVVSILGYSLLPVNMLAGMNIFYRIRLMGDLGVVLSTIAIVWCTVSSTRLFERGCGLREQRFLIGYPNALLYFAFVLLTIF